MEYYQKETNLLDVLISRNKNASGLMTSFFTKSIDMHQCLHATLCHKSSYKKSILYSRALGMKRTCSNEDDL